MYWLRTGNPIDLLPWLTTFLIWSAGGWMLARHAFKLEQHERAFTGLALGMLCFTWSGNLLGHVLPAGIAFWSAALSTLLLGLGFAWKSTFKLVEWRDLTSAWKQALAFTILAAAFLLVGRGLAIYDEPKNLTIISRMANGDIPPHFYMNGDFPFRYHYGSQLFASTLVNLGGLFPWSAFDSAKAFFFGLAVILAGLLGGRVSKNKWGGILCAAFISLAGGNRFLLLLIPQGLMAGLDSNIHMLGISAAMGYPFSQALRHGLTMEGGPPYELLFAFANGILSPLATLHAGTNIFSAAVTLLLLLLFPRAQHRAAWAPLGIALAAWGLAWESSYGLFAIGGAVSLLILGWKSARENAIASFSDRLWQAIKTLLTHPGFLALAFSALFVLLQGGTLTETLREALVGSAGIGVEGAVTSGGFALRWPPALLSSHLGALSIFSPFELLVAVCELGLVIFLTPWISARVWRRFVHGNWVEGAMLAGAWVGLLAPLFLSYQAERDISRFSAQAMFIFVIFTTLLVVENNREEPRWLRVASAAALTIMTVGGLLATLMMASAITRPVLGLKISGLDARISAQVWGQLPPESQIFDRLPWRASMLTGLGTRAAISGLDMLPEWQSLDAEPAVIKFLVNDYQFVYADEAWWNGLSKSEQDDLLQDCVELVARSDTPDGKEFRMLLDLRQCR